MADQAATEGGPKAAPVVIKKYANRRLYNTATSAYVTPWTIPHNYPDTYSSSPSSSYHAQTCYNNSYKRKPTCTK